MEIGIRRAGSRGLRNTSLGVWNGRNRNKSVGFGTCKCVPHAACASVAAHPDLRLRHGPGLARPLNLRMERFNEDLTPVSCLLEVGTAGDTLQEALTAVQLFGNSLLTAIKDLG